MKQYNEKMIAEAGKYLLASNGGRMFRLPYNEELTYEERDLDISKVRANADGSVSIDGFNFNLPEGSEKKYLVSLLFSNDDQIAIILNKEQSEEGAEMFEFMQAWRVFFSDIIRIIKEAKASM